VIELDRLKFAAEVDWVDVLLQTDGTTNAPTVKRHLPMCSYVAPLNAGDGAAASQFRARIQEPGSWQRIYAAIDQLERDVRPLAAPPELVGIEVALDAYSKQQQRDDLIRATAMLYHELKRPVSANRRMADSVATGVRSTRHLLARLERGQTIYIGDRNADVMQRAYVKNSGQPQIVAAAQAARQARTASPERRCRRSLGGNGTRSSSRASRDGSTSAGCAMTFRPRS
jgi:hypothetical protein